MNKSYNIIKALKQCKHITHIISISLLSKRGTNKENHLSKKLLRKIYIYCIEKYKYNRL